MIKQNRPNLKVCAAIHPLVKNDCLVNIISINFLFFIYQYRLKCAMKAMLSQDFWGNMI